MKKNKSKNDFLDHLRKIPIVQVACEKSGLSRNTVYRWRKEDPRFLTEMDSAFKEGEEFVNDMSETQLFTLIKEENLNGQKVWVIEGAPLNENAVADDGYTKSVFYVRQDNNILVRTLNYLKQGNKEKQMDVTNLKKIDGYWVMGEITMVTRKSGQELSRTSLKTADIKFNQKIDDSLFTEKQLTIGLGK